MKITLQGYLFDANFGDMLAARLFYRRCQECGFDDVDFFQYKDLGIGAFCREQVGYRTKKSLLSCFRADAFVIISGGSFWNDKRNTKDAKVRYRRFLLPALIFQLLRKPVYVLGVGGGPVDTPWLRNKMVKVLNKAKVVTFRDEQTKTIFADYGVTNEMEVTADTMLTINKHMLDELEENRELENVAHGRKKLLLHIPDGEKEVSIMADIISPAIIKFLQAHTDFCVVLSNDNIRAINAREQTQVFKIHKALAAAGIDYYFYKYHDCWQMCSLIAAMDCVVTCKLHVGVVAAALEKSVIAFPVHREKTDNFYKMIGEHDRCMNARVTDTEKAYAQIEKYYGHPVVVSDDIRRRAEKNLAVINEIVKSNNK